MAGWVTGLAAGLSYRAMSNLEELARAAQESRGPRAKRTVMEYRSPPPRRPAAWVAPVSLAKAIGWSLTGFAILQALLAILWLAGALLSLVSTNSLVRALGGVDLLMAVGFMAGALTVGALGQIVLLLTELVVQGRARI